MKRHGPEWLPELIAAPLYPLLQWQGRRTRRTTPRLPEAEGARSGLVDQPGPPLHMLALGESPIAGVGVSDQHQALGAQFAQALAERCGQAVQWQALGRNGATLSELLPLVREIDLTPRPDLVLIAVGVNDTTVFRSTRRWRDDWAALVHLLHSRFDQPELLISGVPPLGRFPALPQPLRAVMGLKATVLDQTLQQWVAGQAGLHHMPLALDPLVPGMMASDGYHPSAEGARWWAQTLVDHMSGPLISRLRDRSLRAAAAMRPAQC